MPTSAMPDAAGGSHLTEEERQIYDRQLRVWGVEAQKRMRASRVLLVGVRGLSVEVAKNLVLAGVGGLVLLDDSQVRLEDLATNFLVSAEDVGQNRAESSLANLRLLNPNVSISAETRSLSSLLDSNPAFFAQFRAVCVVGAPLEQQVRLNELLRSQWAAAQAAASSSATASSSAASASAASSPSSSPPPAFFAADVLGLRAWFFEDLQTHSYAHTTVRRDAAGNEAEEVSQRTKEYKRSLRAALDLSWADLSKGFGKRRQEKRAAESWMCMRVAMEWRQQHGAGEFLTRPLSEEQRRQLASLRESMGARLSLPPTVAPLSALQSTVSLLGREVASTCAVVGGLLAQELLKVLAERDEPLSNLFVADIDEGYGIIKDI